MKGAEREKPQMRQRKRMILAEKIMSLRKKNGWSQEELAERLNISRQSVSKWESSASIPDIDRIIAMSKLFGVSTDYLLMEELEKELPSETDDVYEAPETKNVSVEEANDFMNLNRKLAVRMAAGVSLCVLSPTPLILLGGLAEYGRLAVAAGTDVSDMAGGSGIAILLILVAIGVAILILSGMRLEKYGSIERERLTLQYGVEGIVIKKKEDFAGRYRACIVTGVVLCIVGVVPMMVAAAFSASDLVFIYCLDVLLILVAVAVFLFVWAGSIQGSFDKLLQEGDYTVEKKEMGKKISFFACAYWCVITAVFLIVGLYFEEWEYTALIWTIAALLYATLQSIIKAVIKSRQDAREKRY